MTYPDREIGLLVRPSGSASPESRIRAVLANSFSPDELGKLLKRITVFDGDMSKPNLGLSPQNYQRLRAEITTFFNCAALISFGMPIEEARRVNVEGVKNILKLLEQMNTGSRQSRLHHVSTAYAAGDVENLVSPDTLDLNGKFKNTYEQSKAEAEALIRSSECCPYTIYRPSIIVGDSVTGQTSSFNVLYVIWRLVMKGLFEAFLGTPDAPCDVVPVDYAADSMAKLSLRNDRSAAAYHLCVGAGRESNPREIIDVVVNLVNKSRREGLRLLKHPLLVPPEAFALAQRGFSVSKQIAVQGIKNLEKILHRRPELFHQAATFASYGTRNPRFDVSATEEALGGRTSQPPLFCNYCDNLFRYCWETDWGKVPWTNPRNLQNWVERRKFAPAFS